MSSFGADEKLRKLLEMLQRLREKKAKQDHFNSLMSAAAIGWAPLARERAAIMGPVSDAKADLIISEDVE